MSKKKILPERHFVFDRGEVYVKYYEKDSDSTRISIRDISELFNGEDEYLPDIHSRMTRDYKIRVIGGLDSFSLEEFSDVVHDPEFQKRYLMSPLAYFELVVEGKDNTRLCLRLEKNRQESTEDMNVLEWVIAKKTEATTGMLQHLCSVLTQNGMIWGIKVHLVK